MNPRTVDIKLVIKLRWGNQLFPSLFFIKLPFFNVSLFFKKVVTSISVSLNSLPTVILSQNVIIKLKTVCNTVKMTGWLSLSPRSPIFPGSIPSYLLSFSRPLWTSCIKRPSCWYQWSTFSPSWPKKTYYGMDKWISSFWMNNN